MTSNLIYILDPCVPVYCQNKGECEITGNTGQCICPAGYTGNKCQIRKYL